jgi:hypothetical protein
MEDDDEKDMPDGEPEAPMPPAAMAPDGDPTAQGPEEDEEEEYPEGEEEEDEDEDEDEGQYGRKGLDLDPDDALATDTEILKGIVNSAVREAVAPLHAKIKRLESLVKAVPTSVKKATEELISKGVSIAEPVVETAPSVQPKPIGSAPEPVQKGVIAQPGEDNRGKARAMCAKALGLMRDKRASIPAYNDVEYALRMGSAVPDVALKALVDQVSDAENK